MIAVGRVQPKAIRVAIAAIDIAAAVVGIHILKTVAIEITEGKTVHGLGGWEQTLHWREGAVTIAFVIEFATTGDHDVQKAVIVHVAEHAL